MGLVGEYDGACDGADGMNALAEGERIRGKYGSADGRGGGRCEGGVNYGAFVDRLDNTEVAGTALLGAGLAVAEGEW